MGQSGFIINGQAQATLLFVLFRAMLISMEEDTSLVWRKSLYQYGGRHFISMQEDKH